MRPGIATSTNTSASVCNVNGTGPNGTVTHAETASRATHAAEKVISRVESFEFMSIPLDSNAGRRRNVDRLTLARK